MPKSILVDLNVILDILLKRSGHQASKDALLLQETSGNELYISAHMVTTFAYLLENASVPPAKIIMHLDWLLEIFSVVATTEEILRKATRSSLQDYEDAVVEQSAIVCGASVIITRNIKDFKTSTVPAATPDMILKAT